MMALMTPRTDPLPLTAALLLALTALASAAGAADRRSTELLRYVCSSEISRRDVTLFANGTVRLRQGLWESQEMFLDELEPEELAQYLSLLRETRASLDSAVPQLPPTSPEGDWVERCELHLELPGAEPARLSLSRYQIPTLAVTRLVNIAEDLADYTRPLDPPERLPAGYEPRHGDVLRTAEGDRYRVVGLTSDGKGLEVESLDAPIRVFYRLEDLNEVFTALVKRASP